MNKTVKISRFFARCPKCRLIEEIREESVREESGSCIRSCTCLGCGLVSPFDAVAHANKRGWPDAVRRARAERYRAQVNALKVALLGDRT